MGLFSRSPKELTPEQVNARHDKSRKTVELAEKYLNKCREQEHRASKSRDKEVRDRAHSKTQGAQAALDRAKHEHEKMEKAL